jgi:pimeloyl-ACP methyl ester carboxylesterase
MFRFVNIRGTYENEMTQFSGVAAPLNNPDYELADKDVFFVHGFNVDFDGAKNWNREMFKRFWVSGMNARYWGVTWSGDYHVISEKFNGLHYHRDVRQALLTAPTFRNLVNVHGRDAVVIGHSLGNMVVSEALLKGANARAYIMLDAAVASEAYRPELQADSMEVLDKYVHSDWDGYNERSWASNWYTWFTNDVADARGKIGWAGHFAPLLNKDGLEVYTFYSTGDEVFEEASEVPGLVSGVFHWPTFSFNWPFINIDLTLDAYPWQKQEVFKGVNAAGSLSAGWGFHCWSTNINSETVWMKHSAADANAMVADGSIVTNAVFDRGVSAMFKTAMTDFEVADILAFHIPAVSSPAGKVPIRDSHLKKDFNLNASAQRANDWGRPEPSGHSAGQLMPWLHSDIKNMAYYHVYPAFTNIVEKGEMK